MSGTFRFEIRKHETPYPHMSLVLGGGDGERAWVIPKDIPEDSGQQRLAIDCQQMTNPQSEQDVESIFDEYLDENCELWDEGEYEIEYVNKIKMILSAHGSNFNGRFLFHNPGWGRKTKRKLWVLEKLRA